MWSCTANALTPTPPGSVRGMQSIVHIAPPNLVIATVQSMNLRLHLPSICPKTRDSQGQAPEVTRQTLPTRTVSTALGVKEKSEIAKSTPP